MHSVQISENLSFSRIIQGFWRVTEWDVSTSELTRFIESCLDRGVTTLDTADIYGAGECETQVGKALQNIERSRYQIVSKGGIVIGNEHGYYDTSYRHIVETCRATVKKLNCGYLDLYLIHREDPLLNCQETARALDDLKAEGLIREAGVSNFDPFKFNALNHAMNGRLRMNQIEWNPCCFEHFDSGMMDLLQQEGIHPMIWSPLCGGKLFTSAEEPYAQTRAVVERLARKYGVGPAVMVYAWMLKHPVKAMPLVGSGKLARLDEAISALDVEMSLEDWFTLYAASGQRTIR